MVKAEDFRLKGPGSGLVRFSCCVLKQDTLPTQCLFLPRNTIDNSKLSKKLEKRLQDNLTIGCLLFLEIEKVYCALNNVYLESCMSFFFTKATADTIKESDSKDSEKLDSVSNEAKSSQDIQDRTLMKRELELKQNLEIQEKKGQDLDIMRNDDIVVSQQSGNQTNLQDKGVSNQINQDSKSKDYSPRERVLAANHSTPLAGEIPKEEESIKIRDLKSNSRPVEKRSSSPMPRSIKNFLSKQRSRRSKRSRQQVTLSFHFIS